MKKIPDSFERCCIFFFLLSFFLSKRKRIGNRICSRDISSYKISRYIETDILLSVCLLVLFSYINNFTIRFLSIDRLITEIKIDQLSMESFLLVMLSKEKRRARRFGFSAEKPVYEFCTTSTYYCLQPETGFLIPLSTLGYRVFTCKTAIYHQISIECLILKERIRRND